MARESGRSGVRVLIFLGVGVVAVFAIVMVVLQVIGDYQRRIQEASREATTVTAIVAARDLYQGVTITEEDLYAIAIPEDYLHPEVYRSPEHVVGRIPRERILANEFIREERLADADEGIGLNAIIPRGQRAISINISNGNAVSGFLNPGNYVDVLVTLRGDERGSTRETRTLLQAVYVLAVNNRAGTGSRATSEEEEEDTRRSGVRRMAPSVTLAVTPEQAEQVAHAGERGEITLALRNDLDVGYADVDGVSVRDITGETVAAPAPVRTTPRPQPIAPEPGRTIQVIRGTKVDEVDVDEEGGALQPSRPRPR